MGFQRRDEKFGNITKIEERIDFDDFDVDRAFWKISLRSAHNIFPKSKIE